MKHKGSRGNRGKIEIICSILKAISSGADNKTTVSYVAKVSYNQVNNSLNILLEKGLLQPMSDTMFKKWYLVTSKGLSLIKSYEVIEEILG